MNMRLTNQSVLVTELAVGDWVVWDKEAHMVAMTNYPQLSGERIGVILVDDGNEGRIEMFHPSMSITRLRVVIEI
jgi:hypothetical protein